MARLVPSYIDERSAPGEREVFALLQAGPAEWTALHGLDLAPWNRSLRTEIDFVVIVPDAGLLCVEVKSHKEIRFDGSRWLPADIKRSPFKQAADGRYALHRRLAEIAPPFASVPIVHCCIFTNSPFELPRNLSIQPWELIDGRAFRAFQSPLAFCEDIKARIRRSIEADSTLHRMRQPLSPTTVDELVALCLPVQKASATKRQEVEERARKAEAYLRIQQKPILKLAEVNERLIVTGPAGTGKTLTAMELAKRKSESGLRVGLFCFNQLIGDSLRASVEEMTPKLPNLVVDRAFRALARMAEIQVPSTAGGDYWNRVFPEVVRERLLSPEFRAVASFDYLVLDESQDLLARPALFECLVGLLEGGLTTGRFALFGDFEHQVLSERTVVHDLLLKLKEVARPAYWQLSENCRNYRVVGEMALRLSASSVDTYSGYMRPGGSVYDYDIAFYRSEEEQAAQVRHWLSDSEKQGYLPAEISIISFCAVERSVVSHLSDLNLGPAWRRDGRTNYASAAAFKGMENKVVLVTDVNVSDQEFHRDLFYTAITRSTECVRIACSETSMDTLRRWMVGE